MRRILSVLVSVVLLICMAVPVKAAQIEYSLGDGGYTLLNTYTARQVVDMYPQFSQMLQRELAACNEDISVRDYDISPDYMKDIFLSVLYENPEIFYVNPVYLSVTASGTDGRLISLRPTYMFDIKTIPAERERFESYCQMFLSGVDSSWDDMMKCRYIHDLLAQYCHYDPDNTHSDYIVYTSYSAVANGEAVCQGYTLAYNYLLNKLGIDAQIIQSPDMAHSWAIVDIGGNYYHVDVTLDDPGYDTLGRVYHHYCLSSDSKLGEDGVHYNWIFDSAADSTEYDNAWWRDVETVIYPIGNSDYYIDHLYDSSEYGAVIAYNRANGGESEVQKCTSRWLVDDDSTLHWRGNYSYLYYDGTYLYYNEPEKIYRIAPNGTKKSLFYTKPSNISGDIYGLAPMRDGKLHFSAKINPNVADIIYTVESEIHTDIVNPTGPVIPIYTDGDVNLDGKVNIEDVTALQKYIAGILPLYESQIGLADFNRDEKINIKDAAAIQKWLVGITV